MNANPKESIIQAFQKKIYPLIETITLFIDECGLNEKEKFSLTRIHSSFQATINDTVNAILNNQSNDTISQMSKNIDNEFTRFIKRLTYFLGKDQNPPEIPAVISNTQLKIQESIDFLINSINSTSFQQDVEQNIDNNNDLDTLEKKERKRKRKDNKITPQEKEAENTKEKNLNLININNNEKQQESKNINEPADTKPKFQESKNINEPADMKPKIQESKNNKETIDMKSQIQDENNTKEASKIQESNDANELTDTNKKSQITTNENIKNEEFEDTHQPTDIQSTNKTRVKRKSKKNHKQDQNDISIIDNLPKENQQEIIIEDTINLDSANNPSKTELLNQIQSLNNEINTIKLRSNLLEKKLFELTQQSSNWTQSHIDEKCDDPESALFDLLLEQQDILNAKIKKMSNLNEELNFRIEEENSQTNQIVRNNKHQEEEINKEIDDFLQSSSETKLSKANLDKIYFDLKMEIHDINELFKIEQRSVENSANRLSEIAGQITSIEESNKELRSEIKFYKDKCNEIEKEIDLMKSRKTTNKIEALYQTMQDAEIDLFKTQNEYETLVNSTVPDLQYKLKKISEEVSHLAAINKKEQEKAEFVDLQYIKDQVLNAFRF